ncbi:MAG: hypothetical protein AAF352_06960, partial [Pseudomonadota bacterium]
LLQAMIIAAVIYIIVCEILVMLFHNHGLWLAMFIWLILRAVTLAFWLPTLERNAFLTPEEKQL